MESSATQIQYTVVRENWLTRRMGAHSVANTTMATLGLILGALIEWQNTFGAARWMSANGEQVFVQHQWWRAWTTLFVHADTRHLLSNSLMFFVIGVFLVGYFGKLVFPVMAFAVGGLVNLIVLHGMKPQTNLIGVSGVVFWMGGFWLTLYMLIDRRRSVAQRTLRATGVALGIYGPAEAFDPSVSYISHMWGFIFGVAFALIYYLYRQRDFQVAEVREEIIENYEVALPSDTP